MKLESLFEDKRWMLMKINEQFYYTKYELFMQA